MRDCLNIDSLILKLKLFFNSLFTMVVILINNATHLFLYNKSCCP